jgi:integrase
MNEERSRILAILGVHDAPRGQFAEERHRLSGEANIPIVPFHYPRHACASWLLGAGMDVVAVSERLGHGVRR